MPNTGHKWTHALYTKFRKTQKGGDGDYWAPLCEEEEEGDSDGRCVLQRCMGREGNCRICEWRTVEDYIKLEDEYIQDRFVNLPEEQLKPMVIKFIFGHPLAHAVSLSTLLVNNSMTALDITRVIALQTNQDKPYSHSLMEYWREFGAQRSIEDHEQILPLWHHNATRMQHCLYVFFKELDKYEFMEYKVLYFRDLTTARKKIKRKRKKGSLFKTPILRDPPFILVWDELLCKQGSFMDLSQNRQAQKVPVQEEEEEEDEGNKINPIYCSTIFLCPIDRNVTIDEADQIPINTVKWPTRYLLLRDRKLWLMRNKRLMLNHYYMEDAVFLDKMHMLDGTRDMKFIGPVSEFEVYYSTQTMLFHDSPYGGCILLRSKYNTISKKHVQMVFCALPKKNPNGRGCPFAAFRARNMWVTALRLAKHGAIIKQNYIQFLRDRRQYIKTLIPDEDIRVPMDFTDGTGRLVEDPDVVEEMLGHRFGSPSDRMDNFEPFPREALQFGRHVTQKYYHKNLNRAAAEALLLRDGIHRSWLLRDSQMRHNCLTLSYVCGNRVHHRYIAATNYYCPVKRKRIYVATIDKMIAFYDVHSLLEYYSLNKAERLAVILGESIKNEENQDSSPERNDAKEFSGPIDLVGANRNDPQNQPKTTSKIKKFFTRPFRTSAASTSKKSSKKKERVPRTPSNDISSLQSVSNQSQASLKNDNQ